MIAAKYSSHEVTAETCPRPNPWIRIFTIRPRVRRAQLGDGVPLEAGDDPCDEEGEPDRGAGHGAGLSEEGEIAGADHRPHA